MYRGGGGGGGAEREVRSHTGDSPCSLCYHPFGPQDCAFSDLHLHGNCDVLLCADQRGLLHCDVSGGGPGLPGCGCGKFLENQCKY